jgi:hypothetical protein
LILLFFIVLSKQAFAKDSLFIAFNSKYQNQKITETLIKGLDINNKAHKFFIIQRDYWVKINAADSINADKKIFYEFVFTETVVYDSTVNRYATKKEVLTLVLLLKKEGSDLHINQRSSSRKDLKLVTQTNFFKETVFEKPFSKSKKHTKIIHLTENLNSAYLQSLQSAIVNRNKEIYLVNLTKGSAKLGYHVSAIQLAPITSKKLIF